MTNQTTPDNNLITAEPETGKAVHHIVRFDLSQRIEHLVFLISFTILAITGLAQKFIDSPISLFILRAFGGITATRVVHHGAAIVLMWVSIYHILAVLYRIWVLRAPLSMLPLLEDFKHLFTDIAYYLGIRKTKAYYGRYNYAEKVEYLAVVWGTVIMAVTGFMMWNPITTARFLPGEAIPAAKAAHGAEAILAVLAIILWHMYHVHIKRFNRSIFTGKLSREEMEEEHPAELAAIESGNAPQRPPDEILRARRKIYFPIAIALGLVLNLGLIAFISIEPDTAITTLPERETVSVFVPITPTPRPTLAPTPTVDFTADIGEETWEGRYFSLFSNRCGNCHLRTAVGGFNMSTYAAALQGGPNGAGIVPGNPNASLIVKTQQEGRHPGQLSPEELEMVIDWILAGAPER